MTTRIETTAKDVAHLLETFADYVNPDGEDDPWFTLAEINQQFAWEDIPDDLLTEWLTELSFAGKVEVSTDGPEWRWAS